MELGDSILCLVRTHTGHPFIQQQQVGPHGERDFPAVFANTHAANCMRRETGDFLAAKGDAAGIGRRHPGTEIEQRLTGAIGSDDGAQIAARQQGDQGRLMPTVNDGRTVPERRTNVYRPRRGCARTIQACSTGLESRSDGPRIARILGIRRPWYASGVHCTPAERELSLRVFFLAPGNRGAEDGN